MAVVAAIEEEGRSNVPNRQKCLARAAGVYYSMKVPEYEGLRNSRIIFNGLQLSFPESMCDIHLNNLELTGSLLGLLFLHRMNKCQLVFTFNYTCLTCMSYTQLMLIFKDVAVQELQFPPPA
ncbi:hypothetical protein HAX54_052121 [Datura stramonium]|uniref:Uncharacterized protein n=1 Tax=Datura stramonium TaxID=4076 RepID=A0ABS8RRM7_DATST|nr:hypothetical protein [Datura stramonium]